MPCLSPLGLFTLFVATGGSVARAGDAVSPPHAGPAFRARSFFGAKLEPENTVLHGAGQDPDGFSDYAKALGPSRLPVVYMTYVSVAGSPWAVKWWGWRLRRQLTSIGTRDLIPQIGLNMTGGRDTGKGRETDVANGVRDESIEAFCAAVKALNRPVFVRIGYEFEGSWNGYKSDTYRSAFIRITKALRAHNIEAATVWCSAGDSAGKKTIQTLMAYYPGDEWVDWWGIDCFSKTDLTDRQTQAFCDGAASHRKPVMIGEATPRSVGVLKGQASWDAWFAPYFELIHTRPEIKAFCYINWDWRYWSFWLGFDWKHWGDARIERNADVLRLYQHEMSTPLYQHRGGQDGSHH